MKAVNNKKKTKKNVWICKRKSIFGNCSLKSRRNNFRFILFATCKQYKMKTFSQRGLLQFRFSFRVFLSDIFLFFLFVYLLYFSSRRHNYILFCCIFTFICNEFVQLKQTALTYVLNKILKYLIRKDFRRTLETFFIFIRGSFRQEMR